MPYAGDDVSELEARQEPRLVRALEMIAPGTAVREGIDSIVQARTGALICIGDSDELAEVVRNLAIRESEKGLSTGEKQMYTRAKKILASELMYALEMEEDEAEEHLDSLIEDAHSDRLGAAASA